jgi:hypothetical protein
MYEHFKNWRNVQLYPYHMTTSAYGRPQYRTCESCGADAMLVLNRTSNMTDARFEQNVCDRHVQDWQQPALFETADPLSYDQYLEARLKLQQEAAHA